MNLSGFNFVAELYLVTALSLFNVQLFGGLLCFHPTSGDSNRKPNKRPRPDTGATNGFGVNVTLNHDDGDPPGMWGDILQNDPYLNDIVDAHNTGGDGTFDYANFPAYEAWLYGVAPEQREDDDDDYFADIAPGPIDEDYFDFDRTTTAWPTTRRKRHRRPHPSTTPRPGSQWQSAMFYHCTQRILPPLNRKPPKRTGQKRVSYGGRRDEEIDDDLCDYLTAKTNKIALATVGIVAGVAALLAAGGFALYKWHEISKNNAEEEAKKARMIAEQWTLHNQTRQDLTEKVTKIINDKDADPTLFSDRAQDSQLKPAAWQVLQNAAFRNAYQNRREAFSKTEIDSLNDSYSEMGRTVEERSVLRSDDADNYIITAHD